MSRTISTEEEWEAEPVGTLARVGYIEHDDDDGNEIDGGIMFVIRVDGDVRANAGDYMLAGGQYWSEVWLWEQGVTVTDTATILPEPMYGPTDVSPDPVQAALQVLETASMERALPAAVLGKLQDLGWAPPAVYPEGVQVWTISGIPDAGRSDGTQAYLSLPSGPGDKQDRGDIWLEKPTVTVNFEVPRRTIS